MKKLVYKIVLTIAAFASISTIATTASADVASDSDNAPKFSTLYKQAKKQLGTPYVFGATGPSAFDCSGFTSYVYKKAAKTTLPRTAQAQYNKYKHVSYKNIKKGDLVFFGGSKSSISHVGLYVGKGKMIDAQNRGVVTEAVHAPWWHAVGYAHVTDLN